MEDSDITRPCPEDRRPQASGSYKEYKAYMFHDALH